MRIDSVLSRPRRKIARSLYPLLFHRWFSMRPTLYSLFPRFLRSCLLSRTRFLLLSLLPYVQISQSSPLGILRRIILLGCHIRIRRRDQFQRESHSKTGPPKTHGIFLLAKPHKPQRVQKAVLKRWDRNSFFYGKTPSCRPRWGIAGKNINKAANEL